VRLSKRRPARGPASITFYHHVIWVLVLIGGAERRHPFPVWSGPFPQPERGEIDLLFEMLDELAAQAGREELRGLWGHAQMVVSDLPSYRRGGRSGGILEESTSQGTIAAIMEGAWQCGRELSRFVGSSQVVRVGRSRAAFAFVEHFRN